MSKLEEKVAAIKDIEEQNRQAIARALTFADDARPLMHLLKTEHPEIWRAYAKTVADEGMVDDEIHYGMLRIAKRLFPEKPSLNS